MNGFARVLSVKHNNASKCSPALYLTRHFALMALPHGSRVLCVPVLTGQSYRATMYPLQVCIGCMGTWCVKVPETPMMCVYRFPFSSVGMGHPSVKWQTHVSSML